MRYVLFSMILLSLAACGGRAPVSRGGPILLYAEGPMQQACMASDRKARNKALCGCIQAVANGELTAGDRRIAARFWKDPQRAQDMRQSDNPRHEDFWRRYSAYGQTVERTCRPAA